MVDDQLTPSAAASAEGRVGRAFVLAGCTSLAVLVLGAVWVVVTGLLARSQLQQIRHELPELRRVVLAGEIPQARALADRIRSQADRAHALTTGPAWWVAANLPELGSPLRTTRVLASAADGLGSGVVPTVVDLAAEIAKARPTNSTIDLSRIERLAPQLHRAAGVVSAVTTEVRVTGGSWLGAVASARSSVLNQLTRVDGELAGADRAVRLAIPMLGGRGPQRYFIGFMNEAESRGLGGIPGAFAIATAQSGHIHFEHFGADTEFDHVRARVNLGTEFTTMYGQDDPAGLYANSDISPDFRNAAQIWAGMWRAKTGESIDGAIALDPTALGYLLAATGPTQTSNGQPVDADNVVALTQRDLYSRFGSGSKADDTARKMYVVRLAQAVSRKLTAGGDSHALVRAISHAAGERRFVVWSKEPSVESQLISAGWAGILQPVPGGRYAGFVVNNAAGNKLDYYLDRRMTYRSNGCDAGQAIASMTLTNAAPARGLPRYVTVRADHPAYRTRPGDNLLIVTYYATPGAQIRAVTLDGVPVKATQLPERELVAVTVSVELPVGTSRTLSLRLTEPSAAKDLRIVQQPGVRPLSLAVEGPRC